MPPKPSKRKEAAESDTKTRIAIVNNDRCKPKRCRQECKKSCPVVRMGKLCIEVTLIITYIVIQYSNYY